MGTLTVVMTDLDESVLDAVKKKQDIKASTKALKYCLHINKRHEERIASLEKEVEVLLTKLAQYKEHSLDLLSGIAGLQNLTGTKLK